MQAEGEPGDEAQARHGRHDQRGDQPDQLAVHEREPFCCAGSCCTSSRCAVGISTLTLLEVTQTTYAATRTAGDEARILRNARWTSCAGSNEPRTAICSLSACPEDLVHVGPHVNQVGRRGSSGIQIRGRELQVRYPNLGYLTHDPIGRRNSGRFQRIGIASARAPVATTCNSAQYRRHGRHTQFSR